MYKNIGAIIIDTFQKNSQKVLMKGYTSRRQYRGREAIEIINKVSKALLAEGCEEYSRVAIYSQNSAKWSMVDIGCIQSKVITVPIFATNNALQTDYILNDANVHIIFVGSTEQYNEILKIDRKNDFRIIVFDNKVNLQTPKSIFFDDWLKLGETGEHDNELEKRKNSIKEEDIVTLIYTSGTTGKPKGVMLHHQQFVTMLNNHNEVYDFRPEYTSLAFLPLSHVFERGWTYLVLANGLTNVYLTDPKLIATALVNVKPNVYCAVPRLYEKVYAKIIDEIDKQSYAKKKVFYWALDVGRERLSYEQERKPIPAMLAVKNKLADKLVFNKIKQKLGGNLVYCPCGGAYIPGKLVSFFRAIGVPMLVGYGLTETTATVTSFTREVFKVGTVGKPIVNVEVKIGENNEILVKGKTITSGYYKLDGETKDQFTDDGWLKTGDAGHIDEDGFLVITDRIKQLIKTANGKYIAPQLVEGHLSQSPFVSQAMVLGEGKPYASALLTLDREFVDRWLTRRGIPYDNMEELVENEVLNKAVLKSINKEQATLSNYEKVKRFKILPYEFSMERDELTPTLKLKRKVILEKYEDIIEKLYQ